MFKKDEKTDCPLWKAPCKEHGCRWYIHITGTEKNKGTPVDKFDCAISFLPMLLIENSAMGRRTAGEVHDFKNEMVKLNRAALEVSSAVLAIEGKR